MNAERESERSSAKARMNAYKGRIAEAERVKEPMEPGSRADEQVTVRHADASGGDIRENQHEEDRMRDIQIGKRGPEAASEEQPDKLRQDRTIWARSFEFECSSVFRANCCSGISCERDTKSAGVRTCADASGHVDDDVQFPRWMHSMRWMDEGVVTSEKCWNGIEEKMPEISREVELNELVDMFQRLRGENLGKVNRRT